MTVVVIVVLATVLQLEPVCARECVWETLDANSLHDAGATYLPRSLRMFASPDVSLPWVGFGELGKNLSWVTDDETTILTPLTFNRVILTSILYTKNATLLGFVGLPLTAQALLHQYLAKPEAVGIIWFQREVGFANTSGHRLGQLNAFSVGRFQKV